MKESTATVLRFSYCCVLPVGGTMEVTGSDEIVHDDLTGPGAQTEQTRGLLQVQAQARHFAIGPDDHRHEVGPMRLGVKRAAQPEPAIQARHRRDVVTLSSLGVRLRYRHG